MKQIYCKEGTLCSKYPLEPRKIIKKAINSVTGLRLVILLIYFSMIMALLTSFPFYRTIEIIGRPIIFFSIAFLIFLLFLVIYFFAQLIYQRFYFKFYFYDITDKEIVLKKGVIARREITLPFSRIQDIYVDQDFWDRIFSLYDVHIATAGSGGESFREAHIDGVNIQNAEALKQILIEKSRENKGAGV